MAADFDLSYDDTTGEVSIALPDTFTGADIDEILEYTERSIVEAMVDDALCPHADDSAYDGEYQLTLNSNSAFSCHLRGLASLLQEEVGIHYDRFTYFLASAWGGADAPPELEDASAVSIIQIYDEAYFAVETD